MLANKVEVTTDSQWIPVLNWWDLTPEEMKQIVDRYDTIQESSFFRDKGRIYDLADFMRVESDFEGWHGRSYDVLMKWSDCGEAVMVGRI